MKADETRNLFKAKEAGDYMDLFDVPAYMNRTKFKQVIENMAIWASHTCNQAQADEIRNMGTILLAHRFKTAAESRDEEVPWLAMFKIIDMLMMLRTNYSNVAISKSTKIEGYDPEASR